MFKGVLAKNLQGEALFPNGNSKSKKITAKYMNFSVNRRHLIMYLFIRVFNTL